MAAGSNDGDVVLDPFCGCGTACVAAHSLPRQWIGIDMSCKAVGSINLRLQQTIRDLFRNRLVTSRDDILMQSDIGELLPYGVWKHQLYGQQEGRCGGGRGDFRFRHLEVDHIIPQSRGGTDHIEDLQLLRGHCKPRQGQPHARIPSRPTGEDAAGGLMQAQLTPGRYRLWSVFYDQVATARSAEKTPAS